APVWLDTGAGLSDARHPLLAHDRRRASNEGAAEAAEEGAGGADCDRPRARRRDADQAVLPTILPQYGRSSAGLCALQVCAGQRHLPRRRGGHSLARWSGRAGWHPALLRPDDRRDDRLLRLCLPALWPLPRWQWSVPYGAGVSGPSPG